MRGKLIKVKNCSSPLLNWYRPFRDKIFRVDLATKNPFSKTVNGINKSQCYSVISDNPKEDAQLILIADTEDFKKQQGNGQNMREQKRGFRHQK